MATQPRGGFRHSDAAPVPGLALTSPGSAAPPTEPPVGLVAASAAAPVPVPLTAAMLVSALVLCAHTQGLPWPTSLLAALARRAAAPMWDALLGLNPHAYVTALRVLGASRYVIGRAVFAALEAAVVRSVESWPCALVTEQLHVARAELVAERWDADAFERRAEPLGALVRDTAATDTVRNNLALAARNMGHLHRVPVVVQACADAIGATVPDPTTESRDRAAREADEVVTRAMVRAVGVGAVEALVRDALAKGGAR